MWLITILLISGGQLHLNAHQTLTLSQLPMATATGTLASQILIIFQLI